MEKVNKEKETISVTDKAIIWNKNFIYQSLILYGGVIEGSILGTFEDIIISAEDSGYTYVEENSFWVISCKNEPKIDKKIRPIKEEEVQIKIYIDLNLKDWVMPEIDYLPYLPIIMMEEPESEIILDLKEIKWKHHKYLFHLSSNNAKNEQGFVLQDSKDDFFWIGLSKKDKEINMNLKAIKSKISIYSGWWKGENGLDWGTELNMIDLNIFRKLLGIDRHYQGSKKWIDLIVLICVCSHSIKEKLR